ncbi:hypothetical protein [Carboxylicivirga caseinilyticus]|uniref:Cbp1 family collagen-binding glycoprotein adhesin n=1 Tax=Carboxylicivirga caseinilyticus TaxID=3417572 RepID=UPI002AA8B16F|nr:hypothetical protein [uncultured Carboxylicivirga sp.]MCU4165947.1 hypothetical protein [Marinilabiliaceae bacterium A049]
MKRLIPIALIVLATACNLSETKEVKQQKDSLMMEVAEKDRQMNSLVTAMIAIDDNLQQIKEKENIISMNVSSGEASGKALEDRINSDIQLIYDLMLQNKEQISKLEKDLKQSGTNNANLNKLVNRLNQQLKDKTLEIIKLKQQLESQSLEITELNFTIDGLQSVVDSLESVRTATQQQLAQATEQLYKAHYVFGTKNELMDQKIIESDGLFSKKKVTGEGYDEEYFTTIDYREIDSIPLFRPKAKILTVHPESSYVLEEGAEGSMVLKIADKEAFWSRSRYLVIQVN